MATGKSIPANPQRGFTYLGLLMFVMISGIALASTGKVWHAEAQREKERELLFIGEQFRKAIGSYYENTTGVKQYPLTLQDLLEDKRLPQVRHHLRKIYRDPITGTTSWGLVREQGRITGVFSLSNFKPFKQDGFTREFVSFANAEQYTKWRFIHSLSAIELSSVPAGKPGTGAVGSVPPNVAQPAPGVISPPVSPTKPKNRYALCGNQLAIESTQCRESCGELTGPTCHICFTAASEAYGACLRN